MFIASSSCCFILYSSHYHIRQIAWHKMKCYIICLLANHIQNCRSSAGPRKLQSTKRIREEEDMWGSMQEQPGPAQRRRTGSWDHMVSSASVCFSLSDFWSASLFPLCVSTPLLSLWRFISLWLGPSWCVPFSITICVKLHCQLNRSQQLDSKYQLVQPGQVQRTCVWREEESDGSQNCGAWVGVLREGSCGNK